MAKPVGREREIAKLRRSQRAAAVGRLLLAELSSWEEFLSPERTDFSIYGRRDLKANQSRFRGGVRKEIDRFCAKNFDGMDEVRLEKLYLRVRDRLGLELPLKDFENEFAKLKAKTLDGAPRHCTVVISLWGLQMRFPEDMLSKDIIDAIRQIREAEEKLKPHRSKSHSKVLGARDEIRFNVRKQEFASRTCLLACFNTVEAALNGIAWDFAQNDDRFKSLSKEKRKVIEDGKFRDKLLKYPELVTGRALWDENDDRVRAFIDKVQPYRNALVHASPFSKPERYGGIDKLEHIYRIDARKAKEAASITVSLLVDLFRHVLGGDQDLPPWLTALETATEPNARIQ
ncbi:MAG: hypothetical protein MRY63_03070 [Neomegalonema sp.]|nr:hypothetical protein [Neomegalonema sp.]